MEKQTRKRIVALSILVLALVLTGSASQNAYAGCGVSLSCGSYATCPSCEHKCMPMDEACASGSLGPNCEENVNRCYECCIWY